MIERSGSNRLTVIATNLRCQRPLKADQLLGPSDGAEPHPPLQTRGPVTTDHAARQHQAAATLASTSLSHPPAKPAHESPLRSGVQRRISDQIKPLRWFSIMMTVGPSLIPK